MNILDSLREVWRTRSREIRDQWRRSVPFADCIVDRWERARELGFGEGTSIYDSALVLGDVKVGRHSWIGPGVVLDGSGGLEIGDYCSISAGAQIYSHDSVAWAVSGGKMKLECARTSVGSRCYIGPHVVVAKGVTIGAGAVIGAQSLVLHDVPPFSKAFGTPCRVVGVVTMDMGRSTKQ